MTRRPIPAAVKREVLNRQLGVCHGCGCAGPFEFHHLHAVWCGGGNEADNIRALCESCHAQETRGNGATTYGSEVHEAAKNKRLRGETQSQYAGNQKHTRPIKSRGFAGWRKFNGDVVRAK